MQGWLRNGLIAGIGAGIATLVLGLLWAAAKSDYCEAGTGAAPGRPLSAIDVIGTLSGVLVLLLAAGIAGWRSARAGPGSGRPALTGLITGLVSGIGTLVLNVIQFDQNTQCMIRGGAAGPGMDMRPVLLTVAVVVIALGAGLAALAGLAGAAIARPRAPGTTP
jgi:hypothetical protein